MPGVPGLDTDEYWWSGDASELSTCDQSGGCLTCQSGSSDGDEVGDDDDEADYDGEFEGHPSPCSSLSPGSCSTIAGCYMHAVYGSDFQVSRYECPGSPHSCSAMYSRESCEEQGCDWE